MADTPFSAQHIAASLQHAQASIVRQAPQIGKFVIQQAQKPPANLQGLVSFSPRAQMRNAQPLAQRARTGRSGGAEETKGSKKTDKAEQIKAVEEIEEISEEFSQKHDEFEKNDLLELLSKLSKTDSKDDVLRKALKMCNGDPTLADEALDFLILATPEGSLHDQILLAKKELNETHGTAVRAGHNIAEQAREYSQKGLGTRSELRDVYRDVINNPRDAATLFQELTTLYPFEKMKQVIEFTLHSIGADVNSKGPSIERAELHRLMTECRSMQAILGVYRFFKSQMGPIADDFKRQELALPMRLTFETLSKHYVSFLQDRYPSSEKVVKVLEKLGLGEELLGQVAVATRLRNACRQTAPKLFKSEQHRQDIIATLNETIAELDEKIETLMEEIAQEEAEGTEDK